MKTLFVNVKQAISIGEAVVAKHAPLILAELGLTKNDGILDRITVKRVSEEHSAMLGWFGYVIRQKPRGPWGLMCDFSYLKDSGYVDLYVESMLYVHFANKKRTWNLPVRLSRKRMERRIIFALAHELRHYWQFYTGEVWNHRSGFTGQSMFAYDSGLRWEENDANEFAARYCGSLRK